MPRSNGFRDDNWITFTFMLPFVIMRVAHSVLGISDAFLMGDRADANYNLWMALALMLGSLAFFVQTFALPSVRGQSWGWVVPKIIFL
jgi:hypothetical protein